MTVPVTGDGVAARSFSRFTDRVVSRPIEACGSREWFLPKKSHTIRNKLLAGNSIVPTVSNGSVQARQSPQNAGRG